MLSNQATWRNIKRSASFGGNLVKGDNRVVAGEAEQSITGSGRQGENVKCIEVLDV